MNPTKKLWVIFFEKILNFPPERQTAIDFTFGVLEDVTTLVIREPGGNSSSSLGQQALNASAYLSIFSWAVWTLILIIVLLNGLFHFMSRGDLHKAHVYLPLFQLFSGNMWLDATNLLFNVYISTPFPNTISKSAVVAAKALWKPRQRWLPLRGLFGLLVPASIVFGQIDDVTVRPTGLRLIVPLLSGPLRHLQRGPHGLRHRRERQGVLQVVSGNILFFTRRSLKTAPPPKKITKNPSGFSTCRPKFDKSLLKK